jgi:hypothetical protein
LVAHDSDEAFWVALEGVGVSPQGQAPATTALPPAAAPAPTPAPSSASGSPAAAAKLTRTRNARIIGTGRSLRLDTGWRAACPVGPSDCRVKVLIVARASHGHAAPVLARQTVNVGSGKARSIVVGLTQAGARALHKGRKIRALVSLTATRADASPVAVQRNVTLRRAASR